MYEAEQANVYESWVGKPQSLKSDSTGRFLQPTFPQNIKFFLLYQLSYMYFRYFMWNFTGRMNDHLGVGNPVYGNWLSGIPFLDHAIIGVSTNELPPSLQNKGRQVYFFIQLIQRMIGINFLFRNARTESAILGFLFVLTGPLLVLYLNDPPSPPRERDYVFLGSFLTYSIGRYIY